ncbi:MAG: transcription antitermination factor NusB, partial [Deltaproteobacteria bacterium]|nr:transcription antitermination factor NusB [Deltaproteobacteria bacterium]
MGQRHKARELAVQFLYQLDAGGEDLELALENFQRAFGLPSKSADFFLHLIRGVDQDRTTLDQLIQRHSHHWRLRRMSKVDLNILRLAAFELSSCPDIPAKVSINEAVELAKKFGTKESGSFINGILDAICKSQEGQGG